MVKINPFYADLTPSYFFRDMGIKAREVKEKNPDAKIISLGVGDVSRHIPNASIKAMQSALAEMADDNTMRGYPPELGYDFLREAIAKNDYQDLGIDVSSDEIFVSDGSKCDVANVQELFAPDCVIGIPDPVYPVYRDSNIMAGRKIVYLPCKPENNFMPEVPKEKLDVIYLCSPNNPTGTVASKAQLKAFVDYANENDALIIFDSAYKEFVRGKDLPKSIYEIEGAKKVAIETRSFSKTAGFTGVRCAYMVVPKDLSDFNTMWLRRTSTKFNGVSYIVQRGAEAVFSDEGKKEVAEVVSYYLENAKIIKKGLEEIGFKCFGGDNAPYVWADISKTGLSSWEFFEEVLLKAFVICTPGSGFGKCGEGFMRFSALGKREDTLEAIMRIKSLKEKSRI